MSLLAACLPTGCLRAAAKALHGCDGAPVLLLGFYMLGKVVVYYPSIFFCVYSTLCKCDCLQSKSAVQQRLMILARRSHHMLYIHLQLLAVSFQPAAL